jgi:hypothetical protein
MSVFRVQTRRPSPRKCGYARSPKRFRSPSVAARTAAALDRRLIAADRVGRTIDDDLRRVNLSITACPRISALARRMRRIGKRVTPAEIIPVIDGNAQRDDRRIVGELSDQPIGGRTGGTALAGKELEDCARFTRLNGGGGCNHEARNEKRRRDTATLHSDLRLTALLTFDDAGFSARLPHPLLTSR